MKVNTRNYLLNYTELGSTEDPDELEFKTWEDLCTYIYIYIHDENGGFKDQKDRVYVLAFGGEVFVTRDIFYISSLVENHKSTTVLNRAEDEKNVAWLYEYEDYENAYKLAAIIKEAWSDVEKV